jgi:hypothetical protein
MSWQANHGEYTIPAGSPNPNQAQGPLGRLCLSTASVQIPGDARAWGTIIAEEGTKAVQCLG